MPEQVLEADDERKRHSLLARLRNDLHQIDRISIGLSRHDLNISSPVDRKVAGAPAINIVQTARALDVPGLGAVR